MNECSLRHKKCWAVKLVKNICVCFYDNFLTVPFTFPFTIPFHLPTLHPPLPPHLPPPLPLKHKLHELYMLCKLHVFQKSISCFWFLCLILFLCGHVFDDKCWAGFLRLTSIICLVLSCLALPCLVLSCLVLSCLVLSCHVLSCLVLWSLSLPCLVLSNYVVPCLISCLSCLCFLPPLNIKKSVRRKKGRSPRIFSCLASSCLTLPCLPLSVITLKWIF